MTMVPWVVNDYRSMIPGTVTLWDHLLDWVPGAQWVGGEPFDTLAQSCRLRAAEGPPSVIIRNASYFGPIGIARPTISLLQDVFPAGTHARQVQVEVCRGSALVVFNSQYTRLQYPELAPLAHRVIPLPVDFDLFKPMGLPKLYDLCWVGAPSGIKGWDRLVSIALDGTYTVLVVTKEPISQLSVPDNVTVRERVPHTELPGLINQCRMGLCTSRVETQHLAGIEMGGCGLPIAATDVGCYSAADGHIADITVSDASADDPAVWLGAIDTVISRRPSPVRWRNRFGMETCRAGWLEAVASVQ